jgi:hypothetical protein
MSNPARNSYDVSGSVVTNAGQTEVKRAFATGASIGTTTLVAGVAGKKIRVLACFITTVDGLNLLFKSASTTISANIAASGAVIPFCPHGWFQTAAGEALGFAIDAAESTSVQVVYVEVD